MPTFWEIVKNLWNSPVPQGIEPKLMERLAQSFPVPVLVINAEKDRFVWASPGSLWLTGLSLEEILSISARDYLNTYFTPAETISGLLQGQVSQAEVSLSYRRGTEVLQFLGFWIELQAGTYALILQDITELRHAQEELVQYAEELRQQVDTLTELKDSLQRANEKLRETQEQSRLLAAVAAYTDNAVIITDVQGKIIWVNRGFERLTGYTLEEVRGKVPGRVLQGPDTDPATVSRIREKLRKKEPFTEEILNYTKDGSPYWLRLYITPLTNDLNEVTHFIAIEMDITEEKRRLEAMQQQLEDIRRAQEYASRIFKRFLTPPDLLRSYFSDVQIWNEPLAALSGDFYFFAPQEGQVIIALGDSTGHGAAAALISVYALTSLWRSTRTSTQTLLTLYEDLLEGVILSGEQQRHKEGFELALLRYEPDLRRMEFIGARRSLWVFREGQLHEVRGMRGDVSPITPQLRPEPQTLRLQPGDRLYLFSDGLTDQLNVEGKRFSSQRLRNFLQVNQYLPLPEQIDLLKQALSQWRGQAPQTDDILLLALEI
ncbi:MAG: SpoIIE family protein phosphatase [Bacteroidia bacterium]|nr:SpoIIE family protein phosphatase [Bacteroidia bacterium]